MNHVLIVAREEWRYWLRSNLMLGAMLLFALLLVATSVFTAVRVEAERHARSHQQLEAEETFLSQPDRHPHRMVHYGHYAFRTPAPLALFDPGLDSVTGQAIFLEGHRQNSAMFADSAASANLGGFSWLTPALVYQLFAPLLIILLGHGAIVREREASTLVPLLAQNLGGRSLFAGKALALFSVTALLLLPMIPSFWLALLAGESIVTLLSVAGVYFLYLCLWGMATLLVSLLLMRRTTVLAILTTLWLVLTLLTPAIAVNHVAQEIPQAGKIELELAMQADLRKLGDGHNANDPAFAQLRVELLKKHNVTRVEDLPVNIRGVVAQSGEATLTETLNHYAAKQMQGNAQQAQRLSQYGWLSPALAVGFASRAIIGTDLDNHHRFLREAEQLRYDFVQGLNRIQATQLDYSDDINRSSDAQAERRSRVSADNWEVLEEFHFETAPVSIRLVGAAQSILMLFGWFTVLIFLAVYFGGRVKS